MRRWNLRRSTLASLLEWASDWASVSARATGSVKAMGLARVTDSVKVMGLARATARPPERFALEAARTKSRP
jgi:hypothetical protein